jgi:hypothetical protein
MKPQFRHFTPEFFPDGFGIRGGAAEPENSFPRIGAGPEHERYKVRPGDALGNFLSQQTGSPTEWPAVAQNQVG